MYCTNPLTKQGRTICTGACFFFFPLPAKTREFTTNSCLCSYRNRCFSQIPLSEVDKINAMKMKGKSETDKNKGMESCHCPCMSRHVFPLNKFEQPNSKSSWPIKEKNVAHRYRNVGEVMSVCGDNKATALCKGSKIAQLLSPSKFPAVHLLSSCDLFSAYSNGNFMCELPISASEMNSCQAILCTL